MAVDIQRTHARAIARAYRVIEGSWEEPLGHLEHVDQHASEIRECHQQQSADQLYPVIHAGASELATHGSQTSLQVRTGCKMCNGYNHHRCGTMNTQNIPTQRHSALSERTNKQESERRARTHSYKDTGSHCLIARSLESWRV